MKVLAIDPGSTESAFCVWDGSRLLDFDKVANAELLRRIQEEFRAQTDRCVIEMIGHYGKGMPAGKTVFDTCIWIGRFGERYGWDRVDTILRATVKAHLCGSAKAKDGNVRQSLIDRFGLPGTKHARGLTYGLAGDTWQAFSVGVTWFDNLGGIQ